MQKVKTFLINTFVSLLSKTLQREEIQHVISETIQRECIHKAFWKNTNIRPEAADMFYASLPNSISEKVFYLATEQSAKYVEKNMIHLWGTQIH